jgi:hypothetical protein
MPKLMLAFRDATSTTALLDALLADDTPLRRRLIDAGGTRVQVNISDDAVAGAMTISELDPPIVAVVSVWCEDTGPVVDALTARSAGASVLRRPADLPREEWLRRWLDDHTAVAIETQATFGYTQNIVEQTLTADTPVVDAIVEELFPMAAVSDIHAFYGSGGDQAELENRMTSMLTSVARFGADRDLDVVPTSRHDLDLSRTSVT